LEKRNLSPAGFEKERKKRGKASKTEGKYPKRSSRNLYKNKA